MKLSTGQLKTISTFLNDVSKGLMVAVILGQGVLHSANNLDKIKISLSWFALSTFLLLSAMIYSKRLK